MGIEPHHPSHLPEANPSGIALGQPILSLEGASKRYGRTQALDDVTLSLNRGEIVCVLGMNGAGKSTLLRALAGLISLQSGEVRFQGSPLRREQLDHRRGIVFLPDFPPLLWDETVLRNLAILLQLYQADRPGIEDRLMELIHAFDMLGYLDSLTGTLSRGQAYKTSLTALVAIDPPVWLLDEPLASGMDPIGLHTFKTESRAAAKRGRTIVFTTQVLEIAENYADRIAVLNYGQLRALESVHTLRQKAATGENALMSLLQRLHNEGPADPL